MYNIIQGRHGLFYLTDSEELGLFIAAPSAAQAKHLAELAHRALRNGGNIPHHVVCRHDDHRFIVPKIGQMEYEQRIETTLLTQRQIMRILN